MYEARLGAFDYSIERRLTDSGRPLWHWQVRLAGEIVAVGESSRSHAHAETEVQSFIFLTEAKERGDRGQAIRHLGAFD
ncbi:hypothetical protein RA307_27330 [Xanthobacteraceae bacterium Astr-EGSB]|uniref:hypothetical protein n=1 Tax=Astrobacterium formosum TaxID=3069710 RepID=UPI0027B19AFC|nr:hypothetical protein [Xanthobacteraceae bacterium Astr-EGSB]